MKRKIVGLIVISVFITLFMTSCKSNPTTGNAEKIVNENVDKQAAKQPDNQADPAEVYTIKMSHDWLASSPDLKSLFNDSDLVLHASNVEAKYYSVTGGSILTQFIPKVVEIYKGTYDGSYIESVGGIVDYNDYMKKNPDPNNKNKFVTSTGEQPKKIQLIVGDMVILKPGEEYLLFCKNYYGKLTVTNGNQGVFKIEGNKISNKVLKANDSLTKDIERKSNAPLNTLVNGGVEKNKFIDLLKQQNFNRL